MLLLLDILLIHTHTHIHILAHIIMEVKETFPCTSIILLLEMTIDSPYLFGVNRRRVGYNFREKIRAEDPRREFASSIGVIMGHRR